MKSITHQILETALMLGHTMTEEELVSKGVEETMPLESYLLEEVFKEKINPTIVKPIIEFYRNSNKRLDIEELIQSQIHYNYTTLQLTRKIQEKFNHTGIHVASSLARFIQQQAKIKREEQAMSV